MNKRQRKKLRRRDRAIFVTLEGEKAGTVDAKLIYIRHNKIMKTYYFTNVVPIGMHTNFEYLSDPTGDVEQHISCDEIRED